MDILTHCFTTASFSYCISAAIFKANDKFVGTYPGVHVSAWGKGGTVTDPNARGGCQQNNAGNNVDGTGGE